MPLTTQAGRGRTRGYPLAELDRELHLEDGATRFVNLQSTLQAALISASRVLNAALADYLR
ncbi:MAG TPA: hypothetical protein VNH46_10665 [Gemmatimonadales bacterium]|nr:hypothetical protein [Gemmatimonadales bacterium]